MVASVKCPSCFQEFTDPKFLSRAQEKLDRHKGRKNPCDSRDPFKFERDIEYVPPNIGSLDLTELVESLNEHIRFRHVASHIFNQLNDLNRFAVWPNVATPEVYYMEDGEAVRATPSDFVLVYWNRVIQDQVVPLLKESWPRFEKYCTWVRDHNPTCRDFLEAKTFTQAVLNSFLQSEMFRDMRTSISSHLKEVPRTLRSEIRFNMGSGAKDLGAVFEAKCNAWNCGRPLKERGACKFHLVRMKPGDVLKPQVERVEMPAEWVVPTGSNTVFEQFTMNRKQSSGIFGDD
jgi:hypothetical protein